MKIPESLKWKATGVTLGGGGQGKVYQVVDKTQPGGLHFALKALAKDRPRKAYERFHREIEAIKKLEHPNIIRIVDHSEPGAEFSYYVMEYIEGAETLKSLIEKGKNPYFRDCIRSLDLFIQLVNVISLCDGQGIVHRDISPTNILVVPGGPIKVIDFGVCQIEGHETITLVDEAVGAMNYRSLECDSGIEAEVSDRSDVYSAAKVMWTAVTGWRAFAREKPVFAEKSMMEVFPDHPETWHLDLIFENTIRNQASNRWGAHQALVLSRRLMKVIAAGRPPLGRIMKECSVCGVGSLYECKVGHMLFSNPVPQGYVAVECDHCGYCFPVHKQTLVDHFRQRKALE